MVDIDECVDEKDDEEDERKSALFVFLRLRGVSSFLNFFNSF